MEENARVITYVAVQQALRVIIAKLEDVYPIILIVQNLAKMVYVNQTIPVFVIQGGLENCAIKINHGLEILNLPSCQNIV